MMNTEYSLSPADAADEIFLLGVYASTRASEMALMDWPIEQKQGFVQMQFNAQALHYARVYPSVETFLILLGQKRIGRLIVEDAQEYILILDITLLPEHRGKGTGSSILGDLKVQAQQAGKPLRLQVETSNPALRLYERLGFSKIATNGFHLEVEWHPQETMNNAS